MKLSRFLVGLLILAITSSACSPSQVTSPPKTITLPTVAPSVTPIPSPTSSGQPVVVSTAIVASSGGSQSTALPVKGPGAASTPIAPPAGGVTLANNGETYILHPGERFLLNLGIDVYDWTVTINDQSVLSRVINVMVIRGAQGLYEAHQPGQVTLTADGDPFCRQAKPVCGMPSIAFKITLIVQ